MRTIVSQSAKKSEARPKPRKTNWKRDVGMDAPMRWLRAGWSDFKIKPMTSLAYGVFVFIVSGILFGTLFAFGYQYIVFPLIAGFVLVGPSLAVGLYNKSRAIAANGDIGLRQTLPKWEEAAGQVSVIGFLLVFLLIVWVRTSVLLYAIFFGLKPFTGFADQIAMLFTSYSGWMVLLVGTCAGGLFASVAFTISVFSIPMLLKERCDFITAVVTSIGLVFANLPVMIFWGIIVVSLFVVSCLTAFIGLIVIFPLLGHATWHAYNDMRH